MMAMRSLRGALVFLAGVLVGGGSFWVIGFRANRDFERAATIAERTPWDTRWAGPEKTLRIGILGDSLSILHGEHGSTGQQLALELSDRFQMPVMVINCGLGGTASDQWRPTEALFSAAVQQFQALSVQYVVVTLGTNDALRRFSPLSPQEYAANLQRIAEGLSKNGFNVVLNAPPWARGTDVQADNLEQYGQAIGRIVDGKKIFAGDRQSFNYFRGHPDELNARGVHPTPRGLTALVKLWATAFPSPETK